jgi:hypothetical protein
MNFLKTVSDVDTVQVRLPTPLLRHTVHILCSLLRSHEDLKWIILQPLTSSQPSFEDLRLDWDQFSVACMLPTCLVATPQISLNYHIILDSTVETGTDFFRYFEIGHCEMPLSLTRTTFWVHSTARHMPY